MSKKPKLSAKSLYLTGKDTVTKVNAMELYMAKLTNKGFSNYVNEDGSYDALGALGKAIGMTDEEIMSPVFSDRLEAIGIPKSIQNTIAIHNDLVSPSKARQLLVDILKFDPRFELEYTSQPVSLG